MSKGIIRFEVEAYLECDIDEEEEQAFLDSLEHTLVGTHAKTVHICSVEAIMK